MGGAFVFQAMAALHTMFGASRAAAEPVAEPVVEPVVEPDEEVARVALDWDEIRYHAACSLEVHAIKMVEACWREDQVRADPLFRFAAADVALKIDGRGHSPGC